MSTIQAVRIHKDMDVGEVETVFAALAHSVGPGHALMGIASAFVLVAGIDFAKQRPNSFQRAAANMCVAADLLSTVAQNLVKTAEERDAIVKLADDIRADAATLAAGRTPTSKEWAAQMAEVKPGDTEQASPSDAEIEQQMRAVLDALADVAGVSGASLVEQLRTELDSAAKAGAVSLN